VRVRTSSGNLREADALSHGTREQIYLLLRFALASLLVAPNEVTPLILDDVTVQSDGDRTIALLEVIRTLSQERQVILFTQEPDVREWAAAHLSGDNQLVDLPKQRIPA
jgi:uncharacterized protein YhaN